MACTCCGCVAAGELSPGSAKIVTSDLLEDAGLLMPDVELGHIRHGKRPMRTGVHQLYERLRVRIGKRFEQNSVNHGKDGGIDSDAHGHHQNGDGRESGSLAERAHGEAQVAPCIFDPGQGAIAPHPFAGTARIAEFHLGLTASFLG
jgi:hypothetical protein